MPFSASMPQSDEVREKKTAYRVVAVEEIKNVVKRNVHKTY